MFDTILKIITTPCMGYEEKRAILITLRDKHFYQNGEVSELNNFIEMYDELIKKQEEASNELRKYISEPHCIPC